jgi:hypothetical protein
MRVDFLDKIICLPRWISFGYFDTISFKKYVFATPTQTPSLQQWNLTSSAAPIFSRVRTRSRFASRFASIPRLTDVEHVSFFGINSDLDQFNPVPLFCGARRWLIPVCVGVCVYGLGNTVEFSIWRITFLQAKTPSEAMRETSDYPWLSSAPSGFPLRV